MPDCTSVQIFLMNHLEERYIYAGESISCLMFRQSNMSQKLDIHKAYINLHSNKKMHLREIN